MIRWLPYPIVLGILFFCTPPQRPDSDFLSVAENRSDQLRLSVFITAQAVDRLMSTQAGRREALSILRANGITKVYLEVYRSGLVVSVDLLTEVSTYFKDHNFLVVGAIATVPGENFGVRQEARYNWLNFENKKTQEDLKKVIKAAAPIFDAFIIDDFLCTADTSIESKEAKGDRSWPQYRRDLLSQLSRSIFIEPAKNANPDIHMIIKYPQWYDRFHLFGYDVGRQPDLFDEVWVGTETRSMNTQRFGFVQPYEGFVNYRWLSTLSGQKLGGSWFDHIECTDKDFIDQAYQSVLAGSRELTLFNYFNFTQGHPGHHLLRLEFDYLADLAQSIRKAPVFGIPGYKPANSDAGGDLYVMDFIGMLGIPIIPVSVYPEDVKVIFLPTQAAADPDILSKVKQSLNQGVRIVVTSGFLVKARSGEEISRLAGVSWPLGRSTIKADSIVVQGEIQGMELSLDLEAAVNTEGAERLLEAVSGGERVAFLCRNTAQNILVLNSHTFSQSDFDAVGEVLLCPRPLGILNIPTKWANVLREVFNGELGIKMESPTKVAMQPFGEQELMVQNYNDKKAEVKITFDHTKQFVNVFTGEQLQITDGAIHLKIPPRSRVWMKPIINQKK